MPFSRRQLRSRLSRLSCRLIFAAFDIDADFIDIAADIMASILMMPPQTYFHADIVYYRGARRSAVCSSARARQRRASSAR